MIKHMDDIAQKGCMSNFDIPYIICKNGAGILSQSFMKRKKEEETFIEIENIIEEKPRKEYRPNPFLIPLSIIVAGAIVAGAILYNGRAANIANATSLAAATATTATPTQAAVSTQTYTVSLADANTQGNANAKVAFIEFSDYQCPYCQQLFQSTLPSLHQNYFDNGKVFHVFKDFPLTSIHPNAMVGALGARCAGEQGKYWEMHDKLYTTDQSTNDATKIEQYASDLGLNTSQFNDCLTNAKYQNDVNTDMDQGNKLGVQGTPTILIGKIDHKKNTVTGHVIFGAYPYSTFQQELDKVLKS